MPGPQLGELDADDRTALELGSGPGEADEADDPWHIPASHEVLLQGRPLLPAEGCIRLSAACGRRCSCVPTPSLLYTCVP